MTLASSIDAAKRVADLERTLRGIREEVRRVHNRDNLRAYAARRDWPALWERIDDALEVLGDE